MKRLSEYLFMAAAISILTLRIADVYAQDKPKDEPKSPAISDTFKAKFFKAQAQAEKAQSDLQQTPQWKQSQEKQQAFQAIVGEFQKLCGKDFVPQLDQNGDPACVLKPEPPKEPKK